MLHVCYVHTYMNLSQVRLPAGHLVHGVLIGWVREMFRSHYAPITNTQHPTCNAYYGIGLPTPDPVLQRYGRSTPVLALHLQMQMMLAADADTHALHVE